MLSQIGIRKKSVMIHIGFFIFAIFLIVVNINLLEPPIVDFDIKTDQPGMFQIFWAEHGYSEENSVFQKEITPHEMHHFSILVSNRNWLVFGPNIHSLRIDPLDRPGTVWIKDIWVRQGGLFSINIHTAEDFKRVEIIDGISDMQITQDGLKVVSDTNDPKLQIRISPTPFYGKGILFLLACLILLYVFKHLSVRFSQVQYIEWLFFFVLALVICMACFSKPNMHPDEYVHTEAAKYFSHSNHWLPPAADNPEIVRSYSSHGDSRLNGGEIVYLFAGKFLEFFSFLPVNHYLILRLFNVSLFAVLIIFCIKYQELRLFFLPIFISPQIWYFFSYFNSDAFGLFIVFLAAFQVIRENSSFNTYLGREESGILTIIQGVGFGLFFSLLFLIKMNFLFFSMFLGLYFFLRLFKREITGFKRVVKRAGIILLAVAVVFSLTNVVNEAVNNWDRADKIIKMQYKTAKADLNPLLNPQDNNKYLLLRGKGYPLSYIWKDMQWGYIIFMSSFGVFGNMHFYNTHEFYDAFRIFLILATVCICYDLLIGRKNSRDLWCFFLAVFCASSLMAAALYHSWVSDFQAQGRYLLPIIPMIGSFLYSSRRTISIPRINFFVFLLFLLSCDSFIFLGIKNI
jgi:hypothetical protein